MEPITIQATIQAPIETVWKCYTEPEQIMKWNHASDEWHSPRAENDLRVGGRFMSRMEAKDGSAGFDFTGVYTEVATHERIGYVLDDGRKVSLNLVAEGDVTTVTVVFDPEQENSLELQRSGWQAILDNFKKYTESLSAS